MLDNLILLENIDAVASIIENGNRFVVLSHKNPDGDAVGSSIALMLYLRSRGKEAVVVLPNRFPEFLSWLPSVGEVLFYDTDAERAKAVFETADAFFCLDFNLLSRIGEAGEVVAAIGAPKVLIDHHPLPSQEFSVSISHPEACSTSELVFRVIGRLSGVDAVSYEMAQAIYTGMMTDTLGCGFMRA